MKTVAWIISVLFHPLLMATYGCILLFFGIQNTIYDIMTPPATKWFVSVVVFVFSFVFPVINILVLYKLKRVSSISLSDQNERTYPYVMTSIFYFGLYYLLMDYNIWPIVKLFVIGAGIAILLTAIINLKFKISAHMVGIGGLLGAIVTNAYLIEFDMTIVYILIVVVAGLIASSRLILHQHKPYQLYTGFFLGLFVQSGLFFVLQKLTFA